MRINYGELRITASTRIDKRCGGTRREATLIMIIHAGAARWMLWCHHGDAAASVTACKSLSGANHRHAQKACKPRRSTSKQRPNAIAVGNCKATTSLSFWMYMCILRETAVATAVDAATQWDSKHRRERLLNAQRMHD